MKEIKRTNEAQRQLISNKEMLERISVLLEKHHSIQMANIWKLGIITGLRLSNILEIKLENISSEKAFITKNKSLNGEMQEVILSSEALKIINSIRKANPDSEYLFQSLRSRNVTNKESRPLTRQAVNFAFKEVGDMLNIQLTPNMMRHSYITQFLSHLTPSEIKLTKYYLNKK
tara:strand:- start:1616 stop:2137 length:522 start_codon:yes stop_codon:yes gene_type:complete